MQEPLGEFGHGLQVVYFRLLHLGALLRKNLKLSFKYAHCRNQHLS